MRDWHSEALGRIQSRLERLHFRALLDQFHWKAIAKTVVSRLGYTVARIDPVDRSDGEREDPFLDQKRILEFAGQSQEATIFDVGANVGQSVLRYRSSFPDARIHSFEPLPKAYRQLSKIADVDGNTKANLLALYSAKGRRDFLSNRGGANQTSSFLPPVDIVQHSYPAHAFELESKISVETSTVDAYCEENHIPHIHVLKLDTQGTELDVLRGTRAMLAGHTITMAYVEVLFAPLYEGNALYHEIAAFMEEFGLDLFRIYYVGHGAGGRNIGGDALFVQRSLLRAFVDSLSAPSPALQSSSQTVQAAER